MHERNFKKGSPACFAPPITPEALKKYRKLAESASEPIADAMTDLAGMVELFFKTPPSTEKAEVVPIMAVMNGETKTQAKCQPLEVAEVNRIWDAVPWEHELDAMGELFDTIDAQSQADLRNAAFHLLWYGRELTRDREPMTQAALI